MTNGNQNCLSNMKTDVAVKKKKELVSVLGIDAVDLLCVFVSLGGR
jgi:hypothetical protein